MSEFNIQTSVFYLYNLEIKGFYNWEGIFMLLEGLSREGVYCFSLQQAMNHTGLLICGEVNTPFGVSYVATLDGLLCYLLLSVAEVNAIEAELEQRWPKAKRKYARPNDPYLSSLVASVLEKKRVPLVLFGTEFQRRIWLALLDVSIGSVVSYQLLAQQAQRPKAIRAAASAVAHNLIAVAIPCHRVIRASGLLGQYRWGVENKRKLLQEEGCML